MKSYVTLCAHIRSYPTRRGNAVVGEGPGAAADQSSLKMIDGADSDIALCWP
jgi:hypothetical protein